MAHGDTFHPAGTTRDIKVRGPVWVGVWSFVTFGIYAVYWIYVTAKDLSEYGRAKGHDLGQNPVMTLLAFLLGWILLFIPPLVALYRQAKRIQQAQRLAGVPEPMNGWLALVLYIVFSPVFFGFEQSELNKAWAAEGGPVEVSDPMPPRLDTGPVASGEPAAAPEPSEARAPSPERPPGA
jgi:hypothetical protein